jgi:hypothetical protein
MPTISSLGRPDVVTGILPVDSHDALILFDSGATYSFVSLDFVKKATLYSQEISQSVRVSSPRGLITSSVACPGCVILIGDEDFVANLMVIPLPSFDVILGMDWLHHYRAVISLPNYQACHQSVMWYFELTLFLVLAQYQLLHIIWLVLSKMS